MKFLKILIATIFIGISIFVLLLWFVLRTKETKVSSYPPFSSFLQKELILEKDVLLFKNTIGNIEKREYCLQEIDASLSSDIKEVYRLKAGTILQLDNAFLFTNGTSGITSSYVFGTIETNFGKIPFEYNWGKKNLDFYLENPDFFTFPQPVWKTNTNFKNKRYYFEN